MCEANRQTLTLFRGRRVPLPRSLMEVVPKHRFVQISFAPGVKKLRLFFQR